MSANLYHVRLSGTILVAVDVPESAVGQVATTGEPPIKKLDCSFNVIQALIELFPRSLGGLNLYLPAICCNNSSALA